MKITSGNVVVLGQKHTLRKPEKRNRGKKLMKKEESEEDNDREEAAVGHHQKDSKIDKQQRYKKAPMPFHLLHKIQKLTTWKQPLMVGARCEKQ